MRKNTLNIHENQQEAGDSTAPFALEQVWEERLPWLHLPSLGVDQLNTYPNLKAISKESLPPDPGLECNWDPLDSYVISDTPTWILPSIPQGSPTIFGG